MFGLFNKDPVEKYVKRATNKHSQSPERYTAMQKLRDLGTEDALYGLARRFSVTSSKGIEDEQEKQWVCDTLIALAVEDDAEKTGGQKNVGPQQVLGAIRRYILSASAISYPLRVLEGIGSPEEVISVIDELLAREEPEYTRDPSRKIQALGWLRDWQETPTPDVARRVLPYLKDFDENVRFAAVETLAGHAHEDTIKEPLLAALINPDEESRRLKVRIADLFAELGWRLGARRDEIAAFVNEELHEFGMSKDRIVRKEGK